MARNANNNTIIRGGGRKHVCCNSTVLCSLKQQVYSYIKILHFWVTSTGVKQQKAGKDNKSEANSWQITPRTGERVGIAGMCITSEMTPLSLVKKKKNLFETIALDKNRVKNRCGSSVVSMTMC